MLAFASKLIAEPRTRAANRHRTISRAVFLRLIAGCERVADLLTCTFLFVTAQWLEFWVYRSPAYSLRKSLAVSVFIAFLITALLNRPGTAHTPILANPVRETAAAVRAALQACVLLVPSVFVFGFRIHYGAILLALSVVPVLLMIQRRLFAPVLRSFNRRGHGTENVVIYGASATGRRIASALRASPRLSLVPVKIVDEDSRSVDDCRLGMAFRNESPFTVECAPVTAGLLQSLHCDLLLIAVTGLSSEQKCSLESAAAEAGSHVAHLYETCLCDFSSGAILDFDDLTVARNAPSSVQLPYAWAKRILDVLASAVLIVFLSPLLLVIPLLIRFTSRGPALFVQKRVGFDGRLFRMYKFRSMSCGARRYERSPKSSHDPRITRIGRIIRRTSLDELPQLLNVLLGQMSLVGPRPEMPFITRGYGARERQRLQLLPGITGLWQLSSDRPYPIHENLHHDLFYLQHRCLSLDMAILLHTLFFAMRPGI